VKPEIKQKWIDALRSGRYGQTQKVLCRRVDEGIHFCAIGVLSDLYIQEIGKAEWVDWGDEVLDFVWEENFVRRETSGSVAYPVAQWAGLYNGCTILDDVKKVIGLNDEGTSFPRLASYIETHL